METLKLKIHKTLQVYLGKYIPTQELTHVANEICKTLKENGTYDEDVLLEMHRYLQRPDKEFLALQTVNTKSLTNNQTILVMNEIKKAIKEYADSVSTNPDTPTKPDETVNPNPTEPIE